MNESFQDSPELKDTMSEINRALMEPLLRTTLDKVSLYNQLSESSELSAEYQKLLVGELDRDVASLISKKVYVTGKVRAIGRHEDRFEEPFVSEEVAFGGFRTDTDRKIVDGETLDITTINYQFSMKFPDDLPNPDSATHLFFSANIENVDLDFEYKSVEYATTWLKTFMPGVFADLELLLSKPAQEEHDKIYNLKKYQPIAETPEDTRKMNQCIEVYLNSVIDLDTSGVYGCHIDGLTVLMRDNKEIGTPTLFKEERNMVYIREIRAMEIKGTDEDVSSNVLGVYLYRVNEDSSKNNVGMFVPFESIYEMQPLRRQYYSEK